MSNMELSLLLDDIGFGISYFGEGYHANQKMMAGIIMINVNPEYCLRDTLNSYDHKRFIYRHIKTASNHNTTNCVAVIQGKFEDLQHIQFHVIPHITNVTCYGIEDYHSVQEMDKFITELLDKINANQKVDHCHDCRIVRNEHVAILSDMRRKLINKRKVESNNINRRGKYVVWSSCSNGWNSVTTRITQQICDIDRQIEILHQVDSHDKRS